jgi:hypothetical protein
VVGGAGLGAPTTLGEVTQGLAGGAGTNEQAAASKDEGASASLGVTSSCVSGQLHPPIIGSGPLISGLSNAGGVGAPYWPPRGTLGQGILGAFEVVLGVLLIVSSSSHDHALFYVAAALWALVGA